MGEPRGAEAQGQGQVLRVIAVVVPEAQRVRFVHALRGPLHMGSFVPFIPLVSVPSSSCAATVAAAAARALARAQCPPFSVRVASYRVVAGAPVCAPAAVAASVLPPCAPSQPMPPALPTYRTAGVLADVAAAFLRSRVVPALLRGVDGATAALADNAADSPLHLRTSPVVYFAATQPRKELDRLAAAVGPVDVAVDGLHVVDVPDTLRAAASLAAYRVVRAIPLRVPRAALPHAPPPTPTGNPFAALDAADAADAEQQHDAAPQDERRHSLRMDALHVQREIVLARRALGIKSAKTVAHEAARARRAAARRARAQRAIARKTAAAAGGGAASTAAIPLAPSWRQRYAAVVPPEGPFCRDMECVVQHHILAEPKPTADRREALATLHLSKRKSDLAALAELLNCDFITKEQHRAAVRLLSQQLPTHTVPLKELNTGLAALVQPSSKNLGHIKTERQRVREMRLLGFISEQECRARELQLATEEAIHAKRCAMERDWFQLSVHQNGPLADTLSTTQADFAMVGPTAASLIAGSDPKHLIRAAPGEGMFFGERAPRHSRSFCREDARALSLDQERAECESEIAKYITAALNREQMAEFDKRMPALAGQYRCLVRIESRMRSMYCRRIQHDLLTLARDPRIR